MNYSPRRRLRGNRVAPLVLAPGRLSWLLQQVQRRDVLTRLIAVCATIIAVVMLTKAWQPPFRYRLGVAPLRNVVAIETFERADPAATERARERAANQTPLVFQNDAEPLGQLRAQLVNTLTEVFRAPSWNEVPPAKQAEFFPVGNENAESQAEVFEEFRGSFSGPEDQQRFEQSLHAALAPYEEFGLLDSLPPEHASANQREVFVYPVGLPDRKRRVEIAQLLLGDAKTLHERLTASLPHAVQVEPVFVWLRDRMPSTLTFDAAETTRARTEAQAEVPEQMTRYEIGQVLAPAGQPLSRESSELLQAEHAARLVTLSWRDIAQRSAAIGVVFAGLFLLCGYYIYWREPRMLATWRRFGTLLVGVGGTIVLGAWAGGDPWHAELLPLLVFAWTFSLAYQRELALLLAQCVALLLALVTGHGLSDFLVYAGVLTLAVVLTGRIRTRVRLIQVGLLTGAGAALLSLAVNLAQGQPWTDDVLTEAGRSFLWSAAAGFLVTGILPAIESWFNVLTDIRLLELSDPAHPLLQELVRRAPGTYNHSINVAAIAEAAAEAIGRQGLLVRVGAYFHDIGKMLKPAYFVENQGPGGNRHEALAPAMSTLIIIAHIKDGADLARQHRLPERLIDFIEQHHGTTRIEYFYQRAHALQGDEPDRPEVDENDFRYPGPRPQTKEAAVLMLADAAESASRTLVEPGPARLENLVTDLARRRLLDGQFDECGLTLQELRLVQESLVKSLTAVYHGRVKYPEQQTA